MERAFEPDDKITQVMARRIHWMGSRNETHLQEVCLLASRKQGVRLTRFAESYSGDGEVTETFGDVASLDGFDPPITSRSQGKTKLAISKGGKAT